MKAIIVYKRTTPSIPITSIAVEEQHLNKEIEKMRELNMEIICVLHVSVTFRVRYVEEVRNKN